MTQSAAHNRLVVLSSGFPYPVDAGRKAVLAGFLEFAVEALGRDNVVLLCIASNPDEAAGAKLAPCRVAFFPPAAALRRVGITLSKALLLRRCAIQEALVAAPDASVRIAGLLEGFDPDLVLVDTIRMVQHLPEELRLSRRCILYLDDLYSLRYQRMLAALKDYPDAGIDPVGTFVRFLPKVLRHFIKGNGIQRQMLAVESAILMRRERAMPPLFDQIMLLNRHEAERLRLATGAPNVTVIKPLLKYGPVLSTRAFAGSPTFVFLGNLKYAANAYGLLQFLRQAMPRLVELRTDVELLVVGAGASDLLRDSAARFGQNVRFMDYVEDLNVITDTCAAIIVPILFGTGVKIKVIDALARGVPLVSTSIGIDGLDLEDGVHCLIEDDIGAFPHAMVKLLEENLNARMSKAGLAYFESSLSRKIVSSSYAAAIFGYTPTLSRDDASVALAAD